MRNTCPERSSRTVRGKLSTRNIRVASASISVVAKTCCHGIGKCSRRYACTFPGETSKATLTISNPWARNRAYAACRNGISRRHGPHHVPHRSTSTTVPCSDNGDTIDVLSSIDVQANVGTSLPISGSTAVAACASSPDGATSRNGNSGSVLHHRRLPITRVHRSRARLPHGGPHSA